MESLLLHYGVRLRDYRVNLDGTSQIKCPIPGEDNKPSAKYYERSNSFYCWACSKQYSCIDLVMTLENLSLKGAVYFLERFGNLPELQPLELDFKPVEKLSTILKYEDRVDILELKIRNRFKQSRDLKYVVPLFEMLDILRCKEDIDKLTVLERHVNA